MAEGTISETKRAKILTAIIVDPAGTSQQSPEQEIEELKKEFRRYVYPCELNAYEAPSACEQHIRPGTELILFDFGGMHSSHSLCEDQSRRVIEWAENHQTGLVVVVSSYTFRNYVQREMDLQGLSQIPNVVEHAGELRTPLPEWFRTAYGITNKGEPLGDEWIAEVVTPPAGEPTEASDPEPGSVDTRPTHYIQMERPVRESVTQEGSENEDPDTWVPKHEEMSGEQRKCRHIARIDVAQLPTRFERREYEANYGASAFALSDCCAHFDIGPLNGRIYWPLGMTHIAIEFYDDHQERFSVPVEDLVHAALQWRKAMKAKV